MEVAAVVVIVAIVVIEETAETEEDVVVAEVAIKVISPTTVIKLRVLPEEKGIRKGQLVKVTRNLQVRDNHAK